MSIDSCASAVGLRRWLRQHLAAEAKEASLVAVDDRLEGAGVAAAGHGDQFLVALQLQQGRTAG
jgi:hypothetical protein